MNVSDSAERVSGDPPPFQERGHAYAAAAVGAAAVVDDGLPAAADGVLYKKPLSVDAPMPLWPL